MKHVSSNNTETTLSDVEHTDIQPNATDLRLGDVYRINTSEFCIDEESKKHRGSVKIQPGSDGYYRLGVGSYEVVMVNNIKVGTGEAGFVITRSTLNRNGVFLTSGLYDSGYSGVMAGVMHVTTGSMKIKPNTRIGQYIMWNSEMIGSGYSGSYGENSEHDKKYGKNK